jgi:hypothetical protein
MTQATPKLLKIMSGDFSFGDPFGDKEMPLFFLIVFFSLYLTGAGNYSMDAIIWQMSFVESEFEASL